MKPHALYVVAMLGTFPAPALAGAPLPEVCDTKHRFPTVENSQFKPYYAAGTPIITVAYPRKKKASEIAFDIPSVSLPYALARFVCETGREITYPAKEVTGPANAAVVGLLPPRQALERLLAGTGLAIVQESSDGFVLARVGAIHPAVAQHQAPVQESRCCTVTRRRSGESMWVVTIAHPTKAKSIEGDFDIPSERLGDALMKFVRSAGGQLTLWSVPDQDQGLRSSAVKGRFTPRLALDRLLEGTGLKIADENSDALFVGGFSGSE